MALTINGTNIPASGKVVCNGTSLKQLNIGGTKVWQSNLDVLAMDKWVLTHTEGVVSKWSHSPTQLYLDAASPGGGWNYLIVRSNALDLTGFTKLTVTWNNEAGGSINHYGFWGLSTNSNLKYKDWMDSNINPKQDSVHNGSYGTYSMTIPESMRKNGVYFYAEKHAYATNSNVGKVWYTQILIS